MKVWDSGMVDALVDLYIQQDITSDSLIKDSEALAAFTKSLNARLGQTFSPEEVGGELLKLRKSRKLPRIRR
jgi:hypothetical protein